MVGMIHDDARDKGHERTHVHRPVDRKVASGAVAEPAVAHAIRSSAAWLLPHQTVVDEDLHLFVVHAVDRPHANALQAWVAIANQRQFKEWIRAPLARSVQCPKIPPTTRRAVCGYGTENVLMQLSSLANAPCRKPLGKILNRDQGGGWDQD